MENPFFEQPILNSPYEYPAKHWELVEGQPTQKIVDTRRRADFITPIPKPRKRKKAKKTEEQVEMVFDEGKGISTAQQQYDQAPIINELRTYVDTWRTFSEEAQDIVVGDRDRSVDGKGVRAITHAAFTLSLNNYCVDRDMPTPSFVVIDSPLVVYREPDDGEKDFAPDVKANFYRQIAEDTVDRQVIVFENDDPPSDLPESIHVIHFSGSDRGRYGFIPSAPPTESDGDGNAT